MVCPPDSFSIFNIGRPFLSVAVEGYQYEFMGRPGEAVGIDNAIPSESASIPGSKVQTSLVAPLNQFT
jgi:hypothetical protein